MAAGPFNSAEPIVLERYHAQLGRALNNPNLAASVAGSPEQDACIQRIMDVRAAIETHTSPAAVQAAREAGKAKPK